MMTSGNLKETLKAIDLEISKTKLKLQMGITLKRAAKLMARLTKNLELREALITIEKHTEGRRAQ